MAEFRLGLVVGKFAPLHAGHLHLIDQAAPRCDRLLIVSWCKPEPSRCDAAARQRWLTACALAHAHQVFDDAALAAACIARGITPRTLPPDSASDTTQQQFLAWLLRDLLQQQPDAMFASEAYVHPCAEVLAAAFGQPVAAIEVDRARQAVPISASRIRAEPQRSRHFLPPAVWADWVPRLCLLGGESSGKSTLAQALAERFNSPWVTEYGRELWEQQGGHLDEADLLRIARVQQAREDEAAQQAGAALFCDTSALTTLFYSLAMFGRAEPELRARAERRYALCVLCAPDFPFMQDGTRRDAAFRERQHAWYEQALAERGWPVLTVTGSVDARVQQVEAALAAWP